MRGARGGFRVDGLRVLGYLRDPEHPYSMQIAYALRDQIVEAERNVPGLLPLETRMNDRYERFGQRWQPRDMFQPIVNGIRIYMALKGTAGRGGGAGERVAQELPRREAAAWADFLRTLRGMRDIRKRRTKLLTAIT